MSACRQIVLAMLCVLWSTSNAVVGEDRISIHLAAQEPTMYVYEALPITVTITNQSDGGILLRGDMFKEEAVGTIVVHDPSGDVHRLCRPQHRGYVSMRQSQRREVLPGESIETSFLLFGDLARREGPVFSKKGKYRIVAEYDSRAHDRSNQGSEGGDRVVSNAVIVEVKKAPPSETAAIKLIQRLEHPFVLYEPDLIAADDVGALSAIASIKESTVLANYARYALAWRHVVFAQQALLMPKLYDFELEISSARELLGAIESEEFMRHEDVEGLRKELDGLEDYRSSEDDGGQVEAVESVTELAGTSR